MSGFSVEQYKQKVYRNKERMLCEVCDPFSVFILSSVVVEVIFG
jgi:hypothetical protein